MSIAKAERIRSERVSESRTRAAETEKRRSEAAKAAGCGRTDLVINRGRDITYDVYDIYV